MNREETRKAAEIMLHYANGGEVQMQNENGCMWHQYASGFDPSWNWEHKTYRIKRKPVEITAYCIVGKATGNILSTHASATSANRVVRESGNPDGYTVVELKGYHTCES